MNFSCSIEAQELQKIVLQFLQRFNVNEEKVSLIEFTWRKTQVMLEIGVADGLTFNYLNREVLEDCLKVISKSALSILDLLFVVRYYIIKDAERKPLKFDYYLVRFTFGENEIKMFVHHEKGPRHLPVDELMKFLYTKINCELRSKNIDPMTLVSIQTVGTDELAEYRLFNP